MVRELILDLGNSRIKWAVHQAKLGRMDAIFYGNQVPAQLAERSWGAMERPDRLVVVSVAAQETTVQFLRWCEDRWRVPVHRIQSTRHGLGVTNGYEEPEKLGVDRWAAIVAAYHKIGGGALVLSCGSAVTLDAITDAGRHLGGLICPGIELQYEAFFDRTAVQRPTERSELLSLPLFGRGTEQAVRGGIHQTLRHGVRGIIESMRSILGPVPLLVTGGGADLIVSESISDVRHCPSLVLEGAHLLAQESS